MKSRLDELNVELNEPSTWADTERAVVLQKEKSALEGELDLINRIEEVIKEVSVGYELTQLDRSFLEEFHRKCHSLRQIIEREKLRIFFSDKYDPFDAIVEINAGSGGTEAMDWADMLFRMYCRWAEQNGFDLELFEVRKGEQAGIKNVTFLVKGKYAYGYLKMEKGVHRLVRISPFDANKRRHTSFASVLVLPDLDQDVDIKVNPDELEIETFRAGGAGGQYVNKTDSAVRIRHKPTGITVSIQSERSQFKNKELALKILKSKLFEIEREKKLSELKELAGEKLEIDFGSQIRNYVLYPYKLIKDLRSGYEGSNVEQVLDGDLNELLLSLIKLRCR
ncbi:MAG: peptide chain release factor 2 [Deltaproteobacteria bacterium]|nr:peptide chain release factor 2 [Deltaproteobacteria bacterium]